MKAVDGRVISKFWNLSCSPVGAEAFPNKKQESSFSRVLDWLHFFGVFTRHLCLCLEMKDKSVLTPFFSLTLQPNCIAHPLPSSFLFLSPSP